MMSDDAACRLFSVARDYLLHYARDPRFTPFLHTISSEIESPTGSPENDCLSSSFSIDGIDNKIPSARGLRRRGIHAATALGEFPRHGATASGDRGDRSRSIAANLARAFLMNLPAPLPRPPVVREQTLANSLETRPSSLATWAECHRARIRSSGSDASRTLASAGVSLLSIQLYRGSDRRRANGSALTNRFLRSSRSAIDINRASCPRARTAQFVPRVGRVPGYFCNERARVKRIYHRGPQRYAPLLSRERARDRDALPADPEGRPGTREPPNRIPLIVSAV